MQKILDLRREAQECLIYYGNLAKDAPSDERQEASNAFRRIGTGLTSWHIAGYPWLQWCYVRFGYDIHHGGARLISLGNGTQFPGYSLVDLSHNVADIRRCLKLPTPETPLDGPDPR
jgi:hypothetical protein